MLPQVARVRSHQHAVLVLYLVAIEVVVSAALRRLGSGGCSRTQCLLSRRRGLRRGTAGLRRRRRRGLITRRLTGARGEKGRHDRGGDGNAASLHGELPWLRLGSRNPSAATLFVQYVCPWEGKRSEILDRPPAGARTRLVRRCGGGGCGVRRARRAGRGRFVWPDAPPRRAVSSSQPSGSAHLPPGGL